MRHFFFIVTPITLTSFAGVNSDVVTGVIYRVALQKKPFVPFLVEDLTFFGHYWLDKTEIGPLTSQLACLDFSVARGGALVAYRYHTGDKELFADRFVAVDALPE